MTKASNLDIANRVISHYNRIGSSHGDDILFGPDNQISQQDYREALDRTTGLGSAPRTLYVHLPFCPVRCLNCDNNAVITHDSAPVDRYLDGLESELRMVSETTDGTRPLQEIHLGGGSPNYLNDRQLVRLVAMIDDAFNINESTEMSLDSNPKRSSPNQLALLRSLGFNRIHFSLRDLDPKVQHAIGRTMTEGMIRDVFETTREAGFRTISVEMMYGLPCQTADGLKRSMEAVNGLQPDRIACTAYSRRTDDRSHQAAIDQCAMPSLADKLALFNVLVGGFSGDYEWIGLDSFARENDDLAQAQRERRLYRTWLGYSHLPPTDLFGFGSNAVTDLREMCVQNHLHPDQWRSAIDDGNFPIRGGIHLCDEHRLKRNAIRELMCNRELKDYSALMNSDEATEKVWSGYADDGLLSITPEMMSLTDQGRYLLPHLLN